MVEGGTGGNAWAGIEDRRDAALELFPTKYFVELPRPGPFEGNRGAKGGSCEANDGGDGCAGKGCKLSSCEARGAPEALREDGNDVNSCNETYEGH